MILSVGKDLSFYLNGFGVVIKIGCVFFFFLLAAVILVIGIIRLYLEILMNPEIVWFSRIGTTMKGYCCC